MFIDDICSGENKQQRAMSLRWAESVKILNVMIRKIPQRSHLNKDLKKMREGAVSISEERLWQAEEP